MRLQLGQQFLLRPGALKTGGKPTGGGIIATISKIGTERVDVHWSDLNAESNEEIKSILGWIEDGTLTATVGPPYDLEEAT